MPNKNLPDICKVSLIVNLTATRIQLWNLCSPAWTELLFLYDQTSALLAKCVQKKSGSGGRIKLPKF